MFNIPTQRLAKVTVTEVTSAVTLSVNPIVIAALSFTPRHLLVRTNVLATSGTPNFRIRLNSDSGSNYNIQVLDAAATSATTLRETADHFGLPTNVTSDANEFCSGSFLFPDALSTRSHKSVLAMSGRVEDFLRAGAGRWANTAAITSVTLYLDSSTFTAGSTFELCVVDESFNIDEQILGSNGTFSVGSIAAADGDLVVIGNVRSIRTAYTIDNLALQFNSDTTTTNYSRQYLNGAGSGVSAGAASTFEIGQVATEGAGASIFSPMLATVSNYADGSNDPAYTTMVAHHISSSESLLQINSARRNNVEAITAISVLPTAAASFLTGSMLSTYFIPSTGTNFIERQELGSAANITFSDIPQTYDHLELSVYARSDVSGDVRQYGVYFNGDTTISNYERQTFYATNATVAAYQYSSPVPGIIPGATSTANVFGAQTIIIQNYVLTDRHKSTLILGGYTTRAEIQLSSGRWKNTAAITSIELIVDSPDEFEAGTIVELRGIHSTAPAAASDVAALNSIAPADIEAVN